MQSVSEPLQAENSVRHSKARARILILTTDIGAGHDLPAHYLAREFERISPGAQVAIVDCVDEMGRVASSILKDNSRFTFDRLPQAFELQYWLATKFEATRKLSQRLLMFFGEGPMLRVVEEHRPDLIVSTYPGSTAILGELRLKGKLNVPVYSAITDLAGLHFWAHPGVDLHFIIHPESTQEVEAIAGPGSALLARAPSSPDFFKERTCDEARNALGLPLGIKIVAVSGGGWGIGDVVGALEAVLSFEDVVAFCLCGNNDELHRKIEQGYGDDPRVFTIGFTDKMSDVLAAADVLVHSTAGLTVLEAMIRGCSVISFGFHVGHVRVNNEAYDRFGLVHTAKSKGELTEKLGQALHEQRSPDPSFTKLPLPAEVMMERSGLL